MTRTCTTSETWLRASSLLNQDLLGRLGRMAHNLGTRSFLVGGPVRDLILGRAGPDLDIAVEAHAREYGMALARELGGRFVFHGRFLTGTVLLDQPQASQLPPPLLNLDLSLGLSLPLSRIDITQTRVETYTQPAVLPTVRPASIVGDLGRRDFTINALAIEITPGSEGAFIDPFNGLADVRAGRVRVLHSRSFVDDPTRLFRCIRFATRLGFKTEVRTRELFRSAVEQRLPALLTPERILYELRQVWAEPLALRMVKQMVRERVLESAWRWTPRPGFMRGLARLASASSPRRAELCYIYWLSVLPVTERFPITKAEREAARAVAEFGKARARLRRQLKPSGIYRALRTLPEPALRILAAIEDRSVARKLTAFLDRFRHVSVASKGADLRAAGLAPGPRYREVLDKLLFARLDGRIRNVTEERAWLARLVRKHQAEPNSATVPPGLEDSERRRG